MLIRIYLPFVLGLNIIEYDMYVHLLSRKILQKSQLWLFQKWN